MRDDLTQLPAVTRAKVTGVRDYEIAIEVSEDKLREYGLTFTQVALACKTLPLTRRFDLRPRWRHPAAHQRPSLHG